MEIKKAIIKNLYLIFVYIFISIILTILFNGLENINPLNTKWLFTGNDMSAHQSGWFFFKNDIWRFPIGSNPNFGDEIGNSIVYSDSIPLFAIFFKLFNFTLPDKFQYFSIWFIFCFFLQGFLSYLLSLQLTKDKIISFLASILFLLYPIFIYRLSWHPALFAQWTLIMTIYLTLDNGKKNTHFWIYLILLTSLIHFYFTIINLIVFNLLKVFSLIKKKINFKKYLQEIITCHTLLILLMYIVGYFEVRVVDTLAVGFGVYKLNLLSIFDSNITPSNLPWSWILPDIILSRGEEVEGFNFIGSGGLLLLFISNYYFLTDRKLRIKVSKKIFGKGIPIILIVIFILSLSNKISLGHLDILEISLNNLVYGVLSIFRSSGRLFWFVSYFFLFFSIYLLFLKFNTKTIYILLTLLFIQVADMSSTLQYYQNRFDVKKDYQLRDEFWNNKNITNLKYLITSKPVNYNKYFDKFAYYLENNNFEKTNLVKMARLDRSKAAVNRYKLANDFLQKNLNEDAIYIIDNIGHLLSLKEIYKDEDVGFFFKDNVWIMVSGKKNLMDKYDINHLEDAEYQKVFFNNKIKNLDNESDKFFGLGWTHNFGENGAWSEGEVSNLIFNLNQSSKEIYFEFECIPFLSDKNVNLNLEVFVNGKFNNNINLDYKSGVNKKKRIVKFKINKGNLAGKTINIQFRNKSPTSPLKLLISPDSRELGFLLLSFNLINGDI